MGDGLAPDRHPRGAGSHGQPQRPAPPARCWRWATPAGAPGQLENEIKENVWLTCGPDEELVFGADHEQKWARALAKIGVDPERLSSVAGRA